jgi:hypothetical protein
MSRRSPAKSRLLLEMSREFSAPAFGVRFALQHWKVVLVSALSVCGLLTSGCLVTDQILPPEEPSALPVISSNPPVGSSIRFNGVESNELRIPLTVRDQNTTEPLKVRFLLESSSLTPAKERPQPDSRCPMEDVIPGTGALVRTEFPLAIPSAQIPRSACTKLTVVVGSSLFPCNKLSSAADFDKTTAEDDDELHRALAVYWILEVSADPLVNSPELAQRLLSSCLALANDPMGRTN